MDWLLNNSPIVDASSTLVIAVFTVIYAIVTIWLAIETRMLRRVHTKPRVNIRVEADHTGRPGYELTVQNEGQGVAKNVRFYFEGDPTYFRTSWVNNAPPEIPDLPIIKNGLAYLEPSQVYRFPLGTVTSEEFERAVENPWTFCIKYEDLYGRHNRDIYTIDFSLFSGSMFESNHFKEMSAHLNQISRHLKSIQSHSSKQSRNQRGRVPALFSRLF